MILDMFREADFEGIFSCHCVGDFSNDQEITGTLGPYSLNREFCDAVSCSFHIPFVSSSLPLKRQFLLIAYPLLSSNEINS